MTDTYGHTLIQERDIFWGSIYKRYSQGSQIESSSSLLLLLTLFNVEMKILAVTQKIAN